MINLVCLLEERSAQEMLEGVFSRLLNPEQVHVTYLTFEGKQDLEQQLEKKLKYWQKPESRFFIMTDQDSADCKAIKQTLWEEVESSGKRFCSLVRIACHELESFYLGDLDAVERGLELSGLAKQQENRKFRNPDRLNNPYQELHSITKNRYQKIAGSRSIGPHLDLNGSNRSTSFNNLVAGIKKLLGDDCITSDMGTTQV